MAEEEKQEETKKEKESKEDENVVFIGNKPFMNYVTGVVMQFTKKGSNEVIIKARGKFISRAVDVAEVTTKRFLNEENIKVKDIKIDSEEFENKEGKRVNVSTIEITLGK
jgi:DNA-binding protein